MSQFPPVPSQGQFAGSHLLTLNLGAQEEPHQPQGSPRAQSILGQASSATTVNSTTANCCSPHGRGHTGQWHSRAWGRPVMASDPHAHTSTSGRGNQRTELSAQTQTITLKVCNTPASLLQELGTRGKRKKTGPCALTLPLFAGRGTRLARTRPDPGQSTGRGHRWWISVQTHPPELLQHHQLPHGQQLAMSSGQQGAAQVPCPARLDSSCGRARSSHTMCIRADPAQPSPMRTGGCASRCRVRA